MKNNMKQDKVIGWFSGGITSAVAIQKSIELYGKENIRCIFIDTMNEDDDTYRFLKDCEEWYGLPIETISAIPEKYTSIEDVWIKHKGMNFAHGAICSSKLKAEVRKRWQKENEYRYQVFGFDPSETNRAKAMSINYPKAKAIFPLLLDFTTKEDCIEIVQEAGIKIPEAYSLGLRNNNCLKTGCVQGGIGYWQWMKQIKPENYQYMGEMEHYLTNLKGSPVHICKLQTNEAKDSGNTALFLLPHPDYPNIKTVLDVKGRKPMPLVECNGFCGLNDLDERRPEEEEVAHQLDIFDLGA